MSGEAREEVPSEDLVDRGDFAPIMFDDRDTFGVIKAILNLKRAKSRSEEEAPRA